MQINKNLIKNIDYSLILIILLIFILGILIIASATNVPELGLTRQVKVQIASFLLGILAMVGVMVIDYSTLGDFYKVIYVLSIALLLMVYIPGLGIVRGGARSWIDLGIIDFQTSEVAKLGFIVAYAKFLENRFKEGNHLLDLGFSLVVLAPFIGLMLMQPDLGSGLVFVIIALAMIFYAGLSYKILLLGPGLMAVMVPFSLQFLKSHQLERIEAFMNPNDPTLPGNYHVLQSKITIGSGEVYGKGLFQGIYHRYQYLPVQETDFIFAVAVEELGFVGGALIIFLYGILLLKIFFNGNRAKDRFGSLIVMGVLAMFFFQIFENIGMTMGVMPVTGITLPFMSYGGSSIITSMMAIGLVQNVFMRRKRTSFFY
ncbi:MAG: hypothetical protein AVO33_08765 [delta proteobacterium ML8_F1]|nr:MAG: hypothetical protein AVO33_08765 [delta proteobacterium ML8_F1]